MLYELECNPAGNTVTSLQACISWTGGADIKYRDIELFVLMLYELELLKVITSIQLFEPSNRSILIVSQDKQPLQVQVTLMTSKIR